MSTSTIPTRWHAERLRNPPARLRRIGRVLGVRIHETDADVLRLRDGLLRADPVADDFVAWAAEQPPGHGRRLFERAVEEGLAAVPRPPPCLVRWFEPLESKPDWLDRDALRLACWTAWRVGASGGTVLSAMALMGGYRSSAASKPLAMTGALDRMVVRRLGETSRFYLDVVESETFSRFSKGFKSTCRVRLMHAKVRRGLARRSDWNERAWGVPINQTDMAATHLEFSAVYLSGLIALGFRFTADERAAIMHLWRYVGNVLGADDELLAHDYPTGVRHMFIHGLTNPHADDDSRALARALHGVPARTASGALERASAYWTTRYRTAVSRFTLGHEAIDDIGLPREPLTPLLALLSAGRFGLETIRRRVPALDRRARVRGLEAQRRVVDDLVGTDEVHYVPYDERGPSRARGLAQTRGVTSGMGTSR
ncbi:oxygenase MpaB family protein [Paraliomyxa miuraensis]|uniref:oxygenase MpaB family protein n=1 Tax=Paraliomyxa miuraensis TaxID=376150 RepID=UPI0022570B4D|nr:oxygenase MpaB family protein [Paraliomyxa miuraensis]MCX4242974.1 DUF2236 domain-containing protein [Paraliomyxa miuraensis]